MLTGDTKDPTGAGLRIWMKQLRYRERDSEPTLEGNKESPHTRFVVQQHIKTLEARCRDFFLAKSFTLPPFPLP